jgi:hypothetical protein
MGDWRKKFSTGCVAICDRVGGDRSSFYDWKKTASMLSLTGMLAQTITCDLDKREENVKKENVIGPATDA